VKVNAGQDAEILQQQLVESLETAMNTLRTMAIERNARNFHTFSHGKLGTGGFYGVWQRLKASLTGRPYHAEHTVMPKRRADLGSCEDHANDA
jgi:hypothetical protein